ncbi:MAG: hypothetical protein GY847_20290 [Proteobacteria bacterium]|nr:hypothetical protein [Pseudomonadota bacterium]
MASSSDSRKSSPLVTIFLGAGASQFAGYFTFRTFDRLLLSPHLRASHGLPEIDPDIERFLDEVRQALRNIRRPITHDNYLWLLNNYRDFCVKFHTHGGVQRRFESIFSQIQPFSDTIRAVIDAITYTTFRHYGSPYALDSKGEEVREFYLEISKLNFAKSTHLPIFTTNYDLLLETLLRPSTNDEEQVPLVTGIDNLTQEDARWSSDLFSQSTLGIHLYRLHGCVGWFYHGPEDQNIYFHRPSPDFDWETLNSNLCVMFPGREIYPGRDPHGFAFRNLFEAFLSSTIVIFIGFSFRDDDVVHSFLAANAARRRPMRLVVVDRYLNESDVFGALEDSTTRMTVPFQIPVSDQMRFSEVKFGEPGSCKEVLRLIKKELQDA